MKFLPSLVLAIVATSIFATDALSQRGRRGFAPYRGPGVVSGVEWSENGKTLSFTTQGQRYELDLVTLARKKIEGGGRQSDRRDAGSRRGRFSRRRGSSGITGRNIGRRSRGRQYIQVDSPDRRWEAHFKNWNVVLKNKESGETVQVTKDGDEKIHYGTASWVYGEELNQTTAMWWSPDSKKLVYYRFDDTKVEPFHLVRGWSKLNTKRYPEYYPKAGAANPAAELHLYDLESGKSMKIEAGGGAEEYIYNLRASPDGKVMMVNWTDRLQHHLKVLAIDLETGKCRSVVEEHQETWQTNSPSMRFLNDKHRFVWPTEKSGFTCYELRDLDGKLHNTITTGAFPSGRIQFVDEENNLFGFTGNSSKKNPYYSQYHMVGLDGKGQRRVTTLDFHHTSFNLSPDKKWLVAQYEEVNTPPCTALYSTEGKLVAKLAESDRETAANLAEMFKFKSKDGRFDIYGILYKPKNFDPNKKYPAINPLYAGPGRVECSAAYVSSERSECRRGYLVVKVNNRGGGARSKAFLGAAYLRLGDVEIQDHADAIRMLRKRSYFDGDRVGIVGGSYGGYMAAMGVCRHADVYAAAVNKSGVTDWRNYDTIYTERYMSTPQLNKDGYDTGAAMTYVEQFKGKILILHGMLDDNVHPTNAFQLIDAMDRAGKRYESRFFPRSGHGTGRGGTESEIEFFDRVLRPNSN